MSLRVVLYAEGPAEDRGFETWLPASGEPLPTAALGPAHHLVARAVTAADKVARRTAQFVGPITLDGVPARGSMLLAKKTLRRLLTFAHPARRPKLAIVLVDEDGVADRRRTLSDWTADLDLPRVIAVPIREFEAWLIADPRACAMVLATITTPPSPETMRPGEAKRLLQALHDAALPAGATQSERAQSVTTARSALAQRVDLAVLDTLSGWKRFRRDLENELAAIP